MIVRYDLHLHTCLSPCASDDMTPSTVVGMARVNQLDVIAIADHNSCGNCQVAMQAGEHYGILVVPAMELTTAEEIHVLCIFSDIVNAMSFSQYVRQARMNIVNNPQIYGNQNICDIDDNVIEQEEQLLIVATNIGIFDIVDLISQYDGVAIPAHVDRDANGIIAVLGEIPKECGFVTVEVSSQASQQLVQQISDKGYRVIVDSDAHYVEDIGKAQSSMTIDRLSIDFVVKSLSNSPIEH